jgi:hypothetical protein
MRAHQGRRNSSDKLAEGWRIPVRDRFGFEGGIVGKKKGGEGGVVGGFIGMGWRAEGARVSEEAAIQWLGGVPCSGRARPEVDAESDKRATAVSGGEVWSAYPFGKEPWVGRGLDVGLGRNAAPQPF